MTSKKTERLISKLEKMFPDAWFRTMEEWDGSDGIWTGEGSHSKDGTEMFAYWNNMHIDSKFSKVVEKAGYFIEWHDAGTIHIYPN